VTTAAAGTALRIEVPDAKIADVEADLIHRAP
jgi:hypothetical protein